MAAASPPDETQAKPPIIRRLLRVDRRIFSSWRWPASSEAEFRESTVIYGANGSGKSTLARAFADAAAGHITTSGTFSVETGTYSNKGHEASDAATVDAADRGSQLWPRVRVFNQDYVDANLALDEGRCSRPILTLGGDRIGAEAQVEELRLTIDELQREKVASSGDISALDGELRKLEKQRAKQIKEHLRHLPDSWSRNYNAGNVNALLRAPRNELHAAASTNVEADTLIVDGTNSKSELPLVTQTNDQLGSLVSRAHSLCSETPAMRAIAELANDPPLADWVRHGIGLHEDRATCGFCEGSLHGERLDTLAAHFSDAFTRLHNALMLLLKDLGLVLESADAVLSRSPEARAFDDTLHDRVERWRAAELDRVGAIRDEIGEMRALVQRKLEDVAAPVEIDPRAFALRPSDVGELNRIITDHNALVSQFQERRTAAARRLERALVLEVADAADDLRASLDAARRRFAKVEQDLPAAVAKRADLLNAQFTPLPAAMALTNNLARMLGRHELKFELASGDGVQGYEIRRTGGAPATGLSEGERTAIALLYFLEELASHDETGVEPEDLIVVVDDPVSSLDSAITVSAAAYLWDRLYVDKRVAQVILLTHRFDLLRLWATKLGTHDGNGYKSTIVDLRARATTQGMGVVARTPQFVAWPRDRKKRMALRSEYHHQFWLLHDIWSYCQHLEPDYLRDAEASWVAPNVARKLLERFIAFRAPQFTGDFGRGIERLVATAGELSSGHGLAIIKYLHSNSHGDHIPEESHVDADEALNYLGAVFELLVAVDHSHVKDMCEALDIEDISANFSLA